MNPDSSVLVDSEDGNTSLDPDEIEGLRPTYITTRQELDEAEAANISKAYRRLKTIRRAGLLQFVLDDLFVRRLHKQMLGDVWTWAGTYRTSEKNLGVDPSTIGVRVRSLVDDVRTWCEPHPSRWSDDEIAARLHHAMVVIHPFANGNGRHARLYANYLLRALGQPSFTWGSTELVATGRAREQYLQALRAADKGNLAPLFEFVRS